MYLPEGPGGYNLEPVRSDLHPLDSRLPPMLCRTSPPAGPSLHHATSSSA